MLPVAQEGRNLTSSQNSPRMTSLWPPPSLISVADVWGHAASSFSVNTVSTYDEDFILYKDNKMLTEV